MFIVKNFSMPPIFKLPAKIMLKPCQGSEREAFGCLGISRVIKLQIEICASMLAPCR